MISSINGKIELLDSDGVIINVGGIGFRVYMPTSTLGTLDTVGKEVKLHTYLHLREDNVSLYGFASTNELDLFQSLISVSGLGPRLALAMLSAMSIEQLATAIVSGSAALLIEIPGIGKKMANRLILELKDNIGTGWISTPVTQLAEENTEVVAALTSLGYSITEATQAVASLPLDTKLSLEDKIKQALAFFTIKQ